MLIKRKEYNDLIYKAKRFEEQEEEVQQLKKLLKEARKEKIEAKKEKIEKTFKDFNWVVCCDENYNCMIYNNGVWQNKVKSFVAQQENCSYIPELIIRK